MLATHEDVLTHAVQKCSVCQEFQPATCKQPLMSHPLPTVPWQVVASDCFEWEGQRFVVLVDTYSDYIEVAELQDMTSGTLIQSIKPIFATHGVPGILISDNGPNYASAEFAKFANEWDFRHVTSSPHHSQGNGKAESAVKIIKSIIKKASRDGGCIWKAIMEWRNTPTPRMTSSPAQRLMSRRVRTLLPVKTSLYKPEIQEDVTTQVALKRKRAKKYFDRHAKPLPELVYGQPVRVKTRPKVTDSPWRPGIIAEKVAPRSYIVDVHGRQYRRNRIHIRDTLEHEKNPETEISGVAIMPDITEKPAEQKQVAAEQKDTEAPTIRRSGRVSKQPEYLKDFVSK